MQCSDRYTPSHMQPDQERFIDRYKAITESLTDPQAVRLKLRSPFGDVWIGHVHAPVDHDVTIVAGRSMDEKPKAFVLTEAQLAASAVEMILFASLTGARDGKKISEIGFRSATTIDIVPLESNR